MQTNPVLGKAQSRRSVVEFSKGVVPTAVVRRSRGEPSLPA